MNETTHPLIEQAARAFVDFYPRYNPLIASNKAGQMFKSVVDRYAFRQRVQELYAAKSA